MKLFTNLLEKYDPFIRINQAIQSRSLPAMAVGFSTVHKANLVAAAAEAYGPCLVVTDDELTARRFCEDINAMLREEAAVLYPAKDFVFRSIEGVSHEYEQQRLGVLSRIMRGGCRVVCCSIDALLQYTIPPEELARRSVKLRPGQQIELAEIVKTLVRAGYVRRDQVDGTSQFSVRGGIVDLFPPDLPSPVRIELWGDEIDTISVFELDTQRRVDTIKEVRITPAYEVLAESPEALVQLIEETLKHLKKDSAVAAKFGMDAERLKSGLELSSYDKYIGAVYEQPATLLDYFDKPLIFVSEYVAVRERARGFLATHHEDIKILLEEGELCKGFDTFCMDFSRMNDILQENRTVYLDTFAQGNELRLKELITATAVQTSAWGGELKLLAEDLSALVAQGYCCVVLAGTAKAAATLAADLRKHGLPADYTKDVKDIIYRKVFVLENKLSSGFEYPEIKLAVVTSVKPGVASKKRFKKRKGEEIRSLSDLNIGDAVVHVTHGIGIFDGIHKLDLHGIVKDYIKIQYAGADTLSVPVTQLDLVSKYIGPKDDGKIKLNRLNSGEWQKTRARVKKAVDEMADELIRLYAERMKVKGHAFPEDDEWQREFEERFDYEETDDQLRCAAEIKADMEKPVPMERLLCGDVGFGKTEVALRAAFKCIEDGKQCAILCPTTILAWQHYQNILKRFEGVPANIELLSRFRSPKQQRETVKKLKTGEVDIVVGTHRLVQKDIEFKSLGLAIVDEEQRFGVAHKEKFKEMFRGVDMLTLSATPIPRTLNMAMSGIRDMSVIDEPPQDRHPVQTYVIEHDMGVICDAIRRELRRGGQVYYIHNRIDSIRSCAARIQERIPDVRIGIAHGRMAEEELSEIWRQLMEQEIDVLVCTTIIETGVDVANVNTLIIDDADNMGLSQLYQLRGRIGRSNRRAFAYFTFRRGKVLSEVATKRLSAIREFTQFGSGFRIALRDLEIRGAGNILGSRQHGHMEAVGYDMYLRLLSDAISEHKGEKPQLAAEECLVDIQIEAHIPERYIESLSQRIDVYRKIASVKSEDDAFDVLDELIDRFGEPPEAVKGLVDVALLRNTASQFGISEISQKGGNLLFYPEHLNMELAAQLVAALKGRVMVNAGAKPYLSVKMKDAGPVEVMREVLGVWSEASTAEKQQDTQ